jgi:hypothetical protein
MLDWSQEETISSNVLSRLDTVRALCIVGRVNKELSRVVRENVWLWRYAVQCICGTPMPADSLAMVEAWVCPWRAMPRRVPFQRVTSMLMFYDICDLRFVGDSAVVVTFLLKHILTRQMMRIEAVVCLNSFFVLYGEAVPLDDEEYDAHIATRGLATLNLHGRPLQLEVPEEIICSCEGSIADIRCVPIHRGALALYSGGDNTSDVYVFSSSGRLLRRIHVPRNVQEVMVSSKEGYMAILHFAYDNTAWLSVYMPGV